MELRNDMSIIVSSPDSYSDVFKAFIDLVSKFWPDCNYEIVLSNNNQRFDHDCITVVNNGNEASWARRVINALQVVNTRYIMLLTDDSLISDFVNTEDVNIIPILMDKFSLKYYRLYVSPKPIGEPLDDCRFLRRIPRYQAYGRNLMAAVWEREFLMETLISNQTSGWEIESNWLKESRNAGKEDLTASAVDERNILHITHAVYKGKWMPSAIRKIEKKGYKIDVRSRETISVLNEVSLRIKRTARNVLPSSIRRIIKAALKPFGVKFASPN